METPQRKRVKRHRRDDGDAGSGSSSGGGVVDELPGGHGVEGGARAEAEEGGGGAPSQAVASHKSSVVTTTAAVAAGAATTSGSHPKKRKVRGAGSSGKRRRRPPGILAQEMWNLPNMLTLGRIVLIPLFVWLTYEANPLASFLAAAVLAVASITDVVDGYLARKWNLVTVVGKFMDPLADKLIVMAAFVMMVRLGRIAAWVVIVLLAREFIISGLRMVAASEGMVIAAGQEGKWKTSFQLTGLISLCVHYTHPLDLIFATYPVDYNQVGKVLIYVSMVFSVWSAVGYFRAFLATLEKQKKGSGGSGGGGGGSDSGGHHHPRQGGSGGGGGAKASAAGEGAVAGGKRTKVPGPVNA